MCDLSNWIQAGASAVLAFVTGWTLKVLRAYAADTKTLAINSSKQIENAQTPFVTLVTTTESERNSPWEIRNQGSGVGVNITYSRYMGEGNQPLMQWTTSLGPGESYHVSREDGNLTSESGFSVEYESLSGKRYRTVVKRVGSDMKTTFERL
jgi:hypothetical protein